MNEYIKDALTAELEEEKKVVMGSIERNVNYYAVLATMGGRGVDAEEEASRFAALWRFYNKLLTALNSLNPRAGEKNEIRIIF